MTVGTQLQQARRERKLSLGDVTRETKIQPWVLEALEADRLSEMMSSIYVKGFLTTYARFLHLDAESLIAQLPRPKPEPATESLPPAASTPAPLNLQLSWPILRRAAAIAGVTAAVALLVVVNPLKHLPHLQLARGRGAKLASVTRFSDPLTKPLPLPTLTVLASQPLELMINAHQTTWIQVRADGKLLTQQRLQRGANEHWIAKRRFEVVVAKPSQVELTLNGQPIGPFAIAHQGRLLITHRGVTRLPDEE